MKQTTPKYAVTPYDANGREYTSDYLPTLTESRRCFRETVASGDYDRVIIWPVRVYPDGSWLGDVRGDYVQSWERPTAQPGG